MTQNSEEKQFVESLRDSDQPLQVMSKGFFAGRKYPLDYAYGLTIGAGLTRCECGLWGDVEELLKDNIPIPCPHKD